MSTRRLFAAVGLLAALAGTALWIATRAPRPSAAGPALAAPGIAPAAIFAATFTDAAGSRRSLGQFQGKVLVVNFWATWCAPCREEMPGFARLQGRWGARGVQFVGLSSEAREKADRFGRDLAINYPLWTGGDEVSELSRRLGNRLGVLPHTVILGRQGEVLDVRVGPYLEEDLEKRLRVFAPNSV